MTAPKDISYPLPTAASEGDEAWILSAEMLNFLCRKVNAFSNLQAEYPLRVVKSDTGFRLVLVE